MTTPGSNPPHRCQVPLQAAPNSKSPTSAPAWGPRSCRTDLRRSPLPRRCRSDAPPPRRCQALFSGLFSPGRDPSGFGGRGRSCQGGSRPPKVPSEGCQASFGGLHPGALQAGEGETALPPALTQREWAARSPARKAVGRCQARFAGRCQARFGRLLSDSACFGRAIPSTEAPFFQSFRPEAPRAIRLSSRYDSARHEVFEAPPPPADVDLPSLPRRGDPGPAALPETPLV